MSNGFVVLPDGSLSPNKLGDSIKTLVHMKNEVMTQRKLYGSRLPETAIRKMNAQISAIDGALPVLYYELERRKADKK